MNFLNNIGISFKANYLIQGDNKERCNVAKKSDIPNIELFIREDGKDFDMESVFNTYKNNVIFNMPTININLGNLNDIDKILKLLLKYDVKLITIKASNLTMEDYEWSTDEEQSNYISNMSKAIATLASNKVTVAIENASYYGNSSGYYGQSLNQLSDILVYSRKVLVNDFKFSDKDANKYIKISFSVSNLLKNSSIDEIDKWFSIFNESIGCIKFNDDDKYNEVLNKILNNYMTYKLECPILLGENVDIEEIPMKYENYINFIKNYNIDKNIPMEKNLNEDGFTNIAVASMIVLTILIGILMIYVKFHS